MLPAGKVDAMQLLGQDFEVSDELVVLCEQFVACLYNKPDVDEINELRYQLFCANSSKSSSLPPTKDALYWHIQRANYQAALLRRALSADPFPSPDGHWWQVLAPNHALTQQQFLYLFRNGCLSLLPLNECWTLSPASALLGVPLSAVVVESQTCTAVQPVFVQTAAILPRKEAWLAMTPCPWTMISMNKKINCEAFSVFCFPDTCCMILCSNGVLDAACHKHFLWFSFTFELFCFNTRVWQFLGLHISFCNNYNRVCNWDRLKWQMHCPIARNFRQEFNFVAFVTAIFWLNLIPN